MPLRRSATVLFRVATRETASPPAPRPQGICQLLLGSYDPVGCALFGGWEGVKDVVFERSALVRDGVRGVACPTRAHHSTSPCKRTSNAPPTQSRAARCRCLGWIELGSAQAFQLVAEFVAHLHAYTSVELRGLGVRRSGSELRF